VNWHGTVGSQQLAIRKLCGLPIVLLQTKMVYFLCRSGLEGQMAVVKLVPIGIRCQSGPRAPLEALPGITLGG
jgi:hypothetical protein